MKRIATLVIMIMMTACTATDDATPAWVPDEYATPCPTEDSHTCYWDARERGNGVGTSYYVDEHDNEHYFSDAGDPLPSSVDVGR